MPNNNRKFKKSMKKPNIQIVTGLLKFKLINRKLILLLFFMIIYACQNEVKQIEKCNLSVSNSIAFTDKGKKFTGICNIFYNDSVLWKTTTYKRGKKTGETSYYIPEGTLEYVGSERDGKIHGDFISYYRNGKISIEGKLEMGKYVGDWKYYDDDGLLNKTLTYNKKGEKIDSIMHK